MLSNEVLHKYLSQEALEVEEVKLLAFQTYLMKYAFFGTLDNWQFGSQWSKVTHLKPLIDG